MYVYSNRVTWNAVVDLLVFTGIALLVYISIYMYVATVKVNVQNCFYKSAMK